MPYNTNEDLSKELRDILPDGAQTIYRKAFNSAWDGYDEKKGSKVPTTRESTAHRIAWTAVKKSYEKGEDGKWHKKK